MSNLDIEIDEDIGIIRVTPRRPVTVDDACAAIKEIIDIPGFCPGLPSVWDLRQTELMHINADDIKVISKQANTFKDERGEARIAFIVNSDLAYGLGRMFEMINATSHIDARVFRRYEEGECWALNRNQGSHYRGSGRAAIDNSHHQPDG
ncbi:MAG: hypothetical protein ACU84Q_16750 [Gammaproteobacteria bacterium]